MGSHRAAVREIQIRQQCEPDHHRQFDYNSLQVTLRHTSRGLTVFGGYTFSKSQDQASNLGEAVNPTNPFLSKALSAFDVKHNFVVSYNDLLRSRVSSALATG
ncbi:MAG: hypothetical protein WA715_14635 [Candidatus Acidiferrum sp.]